MYKYSLDFQKLLADKEITLRLLEECHFHTDDFKYWEEERAFIAQAINQDGSILDIGCANGFLLRCLEEWQHHKLVPYGVDRDELRIGQARKLFPQFAGNFDLLSIEDLVDISSHGLPSKYDLVYWAVWDNIKFTDPREVGVLDSVMKLVKSGGRLVLGFYDPKKEINVERITRLKGLGYKPDGVLENPSGVQAVCWFDNPFNHSEF